MLLPGPEVTLLCWLPPALRHAAVQVWCLKPSQLGDFVVSGGHDKSVRKWQRTDEPFFIDEEKEKRLEALFEGGRDERRTELPGEAQAEGLVETSARATQVRTVLPYR